MRRNRRKTARDCALHFSVRCAERLGRSLDQKELKAALAAGRLKSLGRQSNTRTFFALPEDMGGPAVLVYDRPRSSFVTVLTVEMYNASWGEWRR